MNDDDDDVELENSMYSQDNKVPRRIASSESCTALCISWQKNIYSTTSIINNFYKLVNFVDFNLDRFKI